MHIVTIRRLNEIRTFTFIACLMVLSCIRMIFTESLQQQTNRKV